MKDYFELRKVLLEAGREDLIGGCEGLIPEQPPKEALKSRQEKANRSMLGEHVHTVPNPTKKKTRGYRPKRKSAKRRDRK